MYFQFRGLPSAIHSSAVASRFDRVASVLASLSQSIYSRLPLGVNFSNAARACAFFARALASSSGTTTSRCAFGLAQSGDATPASFSSMAFLI